MRLIRTIREFDGGQGLLPFAEFFEPKPDAILTFGEHEGLTFSFCLFDDYDPNKEKQKPVMKPDLIEVAFTEPVYKWRVPRENNKWEEIDITRLGYRRKIYTTCKIKNDEIENAAAAVEVMRRSYERRTQETD